MNLAAALYLAAAVAAPQPAEHRLGGAEVADARIAVQILRTAVLREGRIEFNDGREGPRTQQVRREGRVTFEFE